MDKKAIIQELRAWNDAVLTAQALPFLEPLGLTMRFDADVFDEDERQDTGCIALYKGGSVFEKEIIYWINYETMATSSSGKTTARRMHTRNRCTSISSM